MSSLITYAVIFSTQVTLILGHGYLSAPLSRNTLQLQSKGICTYSGDPTKPACGGNAQSWNVPEPNTGCGINQGGGSPYVFGNGDLSFSKWGYLTTYTTGQEITASVTITAFHGGMFQFRIQDVGSQNDPLGSLWSSSSILQVNSYSPQCTTCAKVEPCAAAKTCVQVPLSSSVSDYTIKLQLPTGLSCKHCVIQWNYQSSNSCPDSALSCGSGSENFWNCADISIVSAPNTPSLAPVATTTTVPVAVPVSTRSPIVLSTKQPVINTNNFWCGKTYSASLSCTRPCPLGDPSECGTGETCFNLNGITCPTSSTVPPVITSVPTRSPVFTTTSSVPSRVPVSSTLPPITSSSSSPVANIPTNNFWCGKTYAASLSCGRRCPLGDAASECAVGEQCFNLASEGCLNPSPSSTPISSAPLLSKYPSLAPVTRSPSFRPNTLAPFTPGAYVGLWKWTWSGNVAAYPTGTNVAIAFSGYTDVNFAMRDSAPLLSFMPGVKYLSLGGGNAAGMFTVASINSITSAINAGTITGYDGVAYDIEEGDSGLASAFKASFAAAKAKGLKVLVTVSHSQPYGIADAPTLMQALLTDPNVDIWSPQLYTSGQEAANDYTAVGTPWSAYAQTTAAVVPSIVSAAYYNDAVNYFAQASIGVHLKGYVQWKQV